MEPFRTELSTPTPGSSVIYKKTLVNKTVVTKQKYQMCESHICYCRTEHWIQSEMPEANRYAIASHEFNHVSVRWDRRLWIQLKKTARPTTEVTEKLTAEE